MPSCFVIMPITTPKALVERYSGDPDHFAHVLEHVFTPALEIAGFDEVIPPSASGADLIHAEIIRNLETADLVLCDITTLNANVFFELGIRIALDKPVCLVRDSFEEHLPFDTSVVNCHTYQPGFAPWMLAGEVSVLAAHLLATKERSDGRNALWRYFGLTMRSTAAAAVDNPLEAKIDLVISELKNLKRSQLQTTSRGLETSLMPSAHFGDFDYFVRWIERFAHTNGLGIVEIIAPDSGVVVGIKFKGDIPFPIKEKIEDMAITIGYRARISELL